MNPTKNSARRLALRAAFLAPYGLVIIAWLYFAVLHPVPYWQQTGDYSWYSMSQAFSFESRAAGFPAANAGFNEHPGVPFGVASWLALRFASLGEGGSPERISYVINHAEVYWTWAKFIALALNLAGIYVIHRMFRPSPLRFLVACGVYFAASPAVFSAGFVQLTNESFALVFITAFHLLARGLLTPAPGEFAPVAPWWDPRRDLRALCLGALAALGCSIKIYYLAPAVGLAAGLCAAALLGTHPWRVTMRTLVASALGFMLAGSFVVFKVIGPTAFNNWLQWNIGVISHTNRYGNGDAGFLDWSNVLDAMYNLARGTRDTFPVIFLALCALTLAVLVSSRRDDTARRGQWPFMIAVVTGLSMNLLGVLKHYSPHYALPVCAAFPCLLLALGGGKFPQRFVHAGAVAVPILLAINVYGYGSIVGGDRDVAEAVARDAVAIEKLPIEPDQRRVWGYFSPTRAGVTPMIVSYAGSDFIRTVVKKAADPRDISPLDERDAVHWRYILLPKTYFPTRASIPVNIKGMFDFKLTRFELRPSDTITELEAFFVVARDMGDHSDVRR